MGGREAERIELRFVEVIADVLVPQAGAADPPGVPR
jgi:hypothetical protein